MAKQKLTPKQSKFAEAYVRTGNGAQSAREAGYSDSNRNVLDAGASQALRSLRRLGAIAAEGVEITRESVTLRLHELSLDAQSCGQFGPAVRATELLGRGIGMWVDQQLSVVIGDNAIAAMLQAAERRRREPIEIEDDHSPHNRPHDRWDEER